MEAPLGALGSARWQRCLALAQGELTAARRSEASGRGCTASFLLDAWYAGENESAQIPSRAHRLRLDPARGGLDWAGGCAGGASGGWKQTGPTIGSRAVARRAQARPNLERRVATRDRRSPRSGDGR